MLTAEARSAKETSNDTRRFIFVFVLFCGLTLAPQAEAFCSGDSWGTRSVDWFALSSSQVGISISGNVNHTAAHPTCFGDARAKVFLAAGGPVCTTDFAIKNHLPGDGSFSVDNGRSCAIWCGFTVRSHGELNWNGATDELLLESRSQAVSCGGSCEPPPGGCSIEGCVWDEVVCDCVDCCPLVFDTSGKGYKLTSADRGVLFDINADGQQDAISWTDPARDVAFLAFDRNGNGTVDDGEELFGNVTPLPAGASHRRAQNGFDALVTLENDSYGPSVKDGIIDARDAAYHRLLLWRDTSHDGLSQPAEIQRVSEAGLIAIETRYRESKRQDAFGNEFRLRGISWWQRGAKLDARFFYDVWFVPRH